jgi:hypothetical protein
VRKPAHPRVNSISPLRRGLKNYARADALRSRGEPRTTSTEETILLREFDIDMNVVRLSNLDLARIRLKTLLARLNRVFSHEIA